MNFNPILYTDSYKLSHFLGYPSDAEFIYSYAESRGGVYTSTVFFGLQKFVKELASTRVTVDHVFEAASFAKAHGVPFNETGWMRVVNVHNGRIPIRIKAVAEGTFVPTHNVLVTVENTDSTMPWLTSYIETWLLSALWYPTTVATRIHAMKQDIKPYYERTSDSLDGMGFGVLDFSARGCSSRETAEVGGMAHLLSFIGSDNIAAVLAARKFYDEPMAAFSVAATEHSVATSYGQANENASIEYLIKNMMPENGILSMVGDTWNIYDFVRKIALFQDRIEAKGGTVVIRPDSGDMDVVLPKVYGLVKEHFEGHLNSKGFWVGNNVKILQGDGINEDTVIEPFAIAERMGISADSIMTGSGGGLMQANIDRDTCKFAFKASNVTRGGVDYPIAKNPITDPGKMSKMGRLALIEDSWFLGKYQTVAGPDPQDALRLVYEDGKTYNMESLATIRERLATYL